MVAPSLSRSPVFGFRPLLGRALFTSWIFTVGGLLVALARSGCEAEVPVDKAAAALAQAAVGWRVQHWLPAGQEITRVLASSLEKRGPRQGVDEEIHFDGEADSTVALQRAGWKILSSEGDPSRASEPQMRVFSPDRTLVWTGVYPESELRSEGAVILDDVVLLKLVRGEAVPAKVPVGCAVAVEAPGRLSGSLAKWFLWL